MSTRLLSLLSKIEHCLIEQNAPVLSQPTQRSVNYHKGLARLTFADGGAIALQNFVLADGQVCVKAALTWAGHNGMSVHAIYPHGNDHNWAASAENLALAWVSGPRSSLAGETATMSQSPAMEPLVSIG